MGTTWYGALAIEACGTQLPYLTTDPTNSGGFKVETDNVIKLDPVSAADSGANATLAQFANEYPGLIASSVELAIPTSKGTANAATTYTKWSELPFHVQVLGPERTSGIRLLDVVVTDQARDHHQPRFDQVCAVPARDVGLRPEGRHTGSAIADDRERHVGLDHRRRQYDHYDCGVGDHDDAHRQYDHDQQHDDNDHQGLT